MAPPQGSLDDHIGAHLDGRGDVGVELPALAGVDGEPTGLRYPAGEGDNGIIRRGGVRSSGKNPPAVTARPTNASAAGVRDGEPRMGCSIRYQELCLRLTK